MTCEKNVTHRSYPTTDSIGIPNFPVFTGIKLILIPLVYAFAKNRYTGTMFIHRNCVLLTDLYALVSMKSGPDLFPKLPFCKLFLTHQQLNPTAQHIDHEYHCVSVMFVSHFVCNSSNFQHSISFEKSISRVCQFTCSTLCFLSRYTRKMAILINKSIDVQVTGKVLRSTSVLCMLSSPLLKRMIAFQLPLCFCFFVLFCFSLVCLFLFCVCRTMKLGNHD